MVEDKKKMEELPCLICQRLKQILTCHRFHLMIRGNCSPDARAARFNSTLMPLQIVTVSNIITEVEQLIRNRFTR